MSGNVLEIKNLIKDFPGVRAVNDVSCALPGWRKWSGKIYIDKNPCWSIYKDKWYDSFEW